MAITFTFLLILLFVFFSPFTTCSCAPKSGCGEHQIPLPLMNHSCKANYTIDCSNPSLPIIISNKQQNAYAIRKINYADNYIILVDWVLSTSLAGSSCNFLYQFFDFHFHFDRPLQYGSFFNCKSDYNFFEDTFHKSYNFNVYEDYDIYSYISEKKTYDNFPTNCRVHHPVLFEWRLNFTEGLNDLPIISAGYSDNIHLVPKCFKLKGEVYEKKKVIIGVTVAVGGGLLLSTIFFFVFRLYSRRKRTSSAMLLRASSSEPSSKKDPEMGVEYPTQTFSYGELEEATYGFSASQELGDGGFGTVYKGKLRDGRTVAVKRLNQNNYKRLEQFINEIHILSRLRHQHLVTLYGCSSRQSRELLLVYEYVPNGTVADHLHGPRASERALTWPVRLSIAIETADALAYLHATEPQIIHRDVKTTNILLDTSFHVKVADFGLSRLFPVEATHVSTAPQGTPGYVDPEYHQCYQLTEKSDVFSFGVVLVELISSKPAVDISRRRHEINLSTMAINKIQNNELDQLVDPMLGYQTDMEVKRMITQLAELAFRCLQTDGEMRPAIKEVLEVLKGIENGGDMREKMVNNEADITTNDSPLLNSKQRYSPRSVQDYLSSSSTAATNSSG